MTAADVLALTHVLRRVKAADRCVFRVPTHWPRTGLRCCEIVYARTP